MRALATPSSAFLQPLDLVLGSPAAVRILRVLSYHGGFLSAPAIAERAAINRSGVGRVLDNLVNAGVVERAGQGRSVLYHLADDNYLSPGLAALFTRERDRIDGVAQQIRAIAAGIDPPPTAVWHFGSTARQEDTWQSDYDVMLVGPEDQLAEQKDALGSQLFDMARHWLINPSLVSMSIADVRDNAAHNSAFWQNLNRDCQVLYGKSPKQVIHGQKQR